MDDTGIELKQLTNWFVNNRKRYWKPRVEARLQQQAAVAAVSPTKIVQAASTVTPYIALDMTKPPQVSVSPSPSQHTRDGTSVNMVNASAFVSFDRSRSPRAVSIGSSSFASESDNASLSNDTDDDLTDDIVDEVDADSQMVKRTETVDVHILRPTGDDPLPTLEDVSILANVPSDRIMQSYDGCTLSYRFPVEGFSDQKKVQSRRDSEIVKMKKQYLKKFLAETAAAVAGITSASEEPRKASKKRSRSNEDEEIATNRPKFLRKSTPLWRDACRSAGDIYDRELPSLEEASHLFGYSEA